MDEKREKVLERVIRWIIEGSDEDYCKICARVGENQDVADDVDPCPCRRERGITACQEGIIEHFFGGQGE